MCIYIYLHTELSQNISEIRDSKIDWLPCLRTITVEFRVSTIEGIEDHLFYKMFYGKKQYVIDECLLKSHLSHSALRGAYFCMILSVCFL